jgi:LacI family transcriptional regulator
LEENNVMNTIKDVARLANVALSTASYAINDTGKVSKETKQKVLKAAKELGYIPNGVARDLKNNKKTRVICVFVGDLGGPFFSEIMKGIQDETLKNNYNLIACNHNMADRFLSERRVDGAIILSASVPDDLILRVAGPHFPIVVMDRKLEGEYIYNVLLDNVQGAYQATKYLIELGNKKIAYFGGASHSYDNVKRFEGYKQALMENGVTFDENLVFQGYFTEKGGYEAMKLLLLKSGLDNNHIDAVFCGNDEMAIGAIKALSEEGIRIPKDISIVGYDDIRLASYVQPPLTTISHYKYAWGVMAANLVLEGLKDDIKSRNIIMPAKLIVRNSCRALPDKNI